MPPKKGAGRKPATATKSSASPTLPKPFVTAPSHLQPLYATLDPSHIYLVHVDAHPAAFKRKIFLVPLAMNVGIALLFAWRAWSVLPYYLSLLASAIGQANEYTILAASHSYGELSMVILRRTASFLVDFLLCIFVWPWPWEFFVGSSATTGSPLGWRWQTGFRDREIYVRRSRAWDAALGDVLGNADSDPSQRGEFWARVRDATNPLLLQGKTGYLLMDGSWDLDWDAMVLAAWLVDKKDAGLDDFSGPLVLLHSERFGWVVVSLGQGESDANEEHRRKQVFAFRDALTKLGKEDLFFRWIEIVQFETNKPGGFGAERQYETAEQIRELFKKNGVDFDAVWAEIVSTSQR
ncbi:hypothetical protein B0T18DRAFT_116192 [Schizothecium vesticola]|uniref:Uncharacterized protein n=1 Tax=Schizothecium vesticola TaxID=314040 RepID=A0AA40F250_9PEZI|nr:hypothetical protein B0T18DRAFT_116192 [Schizothecium vesticola]